MPLKRHKFDDGLILTVSRPAVDVNLFSGVPRSAFSDIQSEYPRYRGVINANEGSPADVLADVVEEGGNAFAQEERLKNSSACSITADDCSVIITAFAPPSKTVLISGCQFADLVTGLVEEMETSLAATASAEEEVERQRELVSIAD